MLSLHLRRWPAVEPAESLLLNLLQVRAWERGELWFRGQALESGTSLGLNPNSTIPSCVTEASDLTSLSLFPHLMMTVRLRIVVVKVMMEEDGDGGDDNDESDYGSGDGDTDSANTGDDGDDDYGDDDRLMKRSRW